VSKRRVRKMAGASAALCVGGCAREGVPPERVAAAVDHLPHLAARRRRRSARRVSAKRVWRRVCTRQGNNKPKSCAWRNVRGARVARAPVRRRARGAHSHLHVQRRRQPDAAPQRHDGARGEAHHRGRAQTLRSVRERRRGRGSAARRAIGARRGAARRTRGRDERHACGAKPGGAARGARCGAERRKGRAKIGGDPRRSGHGRGLRAPARRRAARRAAQARVVRVRSTPRQAAARVRMRRAAAGIAWGRRAMLDAAAPRLGGPTQPVRARAQRQH
jgi:hypothetical protein